MTFWKRQNLRTETHPWPPGRSGVGVGVERGWITEAHRELGSDRVSTFDCAAGYRIVCVPQTPRTLHRTGFCFTVLTLHLSFLKGSKMTQGGNKGCEVLGQVELPAYKIIN